MIIYPHTKNKEILILRIIYTCTTLTPPVVYNLIYYLFCQNLDRWGDFFQLYYSLMGELFFF